MFTGIVQSLGVLSGLTRHSEGVRLDFQGGYPHEFPLRIGDSVSVNGVCLTATHLTSEGFSAFAVPETLSLTTLGDLQVGHTVNLEPALTPTAPLGGHYVQGHVDGVAEVTSVKIMNGATAKNDDASDTGNRELTVRLPSDHLRYCIVKGSLTLNGVSLTIASIEGAELRFALVPHTLQKTNLGKAVAGTRLNFEVDLLAKYVERLLVTHPAGSESMGQFPKSSESALTSDRLREWGYGV